MQNHETSFEEDFKSYINYSREDLIPMISHFRALGYQFIEECSKDINLFSKNIKKDFDKKLKDEFTNVSQTLYIEIEDAFQKPIDNQNTILWDLKTIEKLFLVKKLLGKLCQNH
jgi:hypothetical protein